MGGGSGTGVLPVPKQPQRWLLEGGHLGPLLLHQLREV